MIGCVIEEDRSKMQSYGIRSPVDPSGEVTTPAESILKS